jgi:hypothetical protein
LKKFKTSKEVKKATKPVIEIEFPRTEKILIDLKKGQTEAESAFRRICVEKNDMIE